MQIQVLLEEVILIAKDAGQSILHIYNQEDYKKWRKDDNTPLTTADLAANKLIMERLLTLTPDVPILSEESADIEVEQVREWPLYWLVDPLDGTQDFINRTGDFSVVIALMKEHKPVLGVIVEPVADKVYFAMEQAGAYVQQGYEQPQKLLLTSDDEGQPDVIQVVISSRESEASYLQHLNDSYQYQFSSKGSCSLKCCYVADGSADCYVRVGPTSIWDTAAAQCIVEEAGGKIFNLSHQPLTYQIEDSWLNPPFYVVGAMPLDWQSIFKS